MGRGWSRGSPCTADVKGKRIAVPGLLTSAYLALQLAEPDFDPVFIPFDAIEEAVETARWTWGCSSTKAS